MLVLVQRPQHKSTPDPVAAPTNIPFGTIFIEFGDTKKCCTFSGLELVPKSRKKLIGALSYMHKGPKCIQSLWDHPKKFLLFKRTKKARYVRSLGKKPHFGAFPEAKKGVVNCAKLRKAAHWPNKNANPSGLPEKSLLCRKSAILSIRWKKPHFGAFPEAQKANWRSQLHAQSSQMHSIPLGPSEKNSFCAKVQRKRNMCDP